jgi:hypothetical protein
MCFVGLSVSLRLRGEIILSEKQAFIDLYYGEVIMAKYGKAAGESVKRAMRKKKKGTLKSGRSGKKVKSRKQAIAIGLSEARKKGAKVPKKKSAPKKTSKKKSPKK